jgi:glutamyl-tRNA reductase
MTGAPSHPASQLISLALTQDALETDLGAHLFAEQPDMAALYRRLRAAPLREVLALSTCERLELFTLADEAGTERTLLDIMAAEAGVATDMLRPLVRGRHGEEAIAHLFAVAAALESQVIGEPQILGQVKESHRQATALGLVGPGLEAMLQAAYAAAKRVRSETEIGRYPVSIAASALLVARDVHGDLRRCDALLIGLGEMGEFMAAELKSAGVRDLTILHPGQARARAAAHRLGCHFRPWDDLEAAMAGAEIVVGALGAGRITVTRDLAARTLRARRSAPIYFIDAAVPRDIEPAVNDLDGAFVYDLVDLERIALSGRASRESALNAARGILAEELAGFARRHAAREAVPSVIALRRHVEALRADILAGGDLSAEEATRRLVNRLLHEPSAALRAAAVGDGIKSTGLDAAIKRLFRLDGEGSKIPPDSGQGDDT